MLQIGPPRRRPGPSRSGAVGRRNAPGPNQSHDRRTGPDRNALLLASSNDLSDVEFRNELLTRPNRLPRGGGPAAAADGRVGAGHVDRRGATPGARAARPRHPHPEPTSAHFQDYVQYPYGAAYHFWQAGAESREIAPPGRSPANAPPAPRSRPVRLRIGVVDRAGQGRVYGTLTQAELMLEEQFGLPRPTWLSPSAYLGP